MDNFLINFCPFKRNGLWIKEKKIEKNIFVLYAVLNIFSDKIIFYKEITVLREDEMKTRFKKTYIKNSLFSFNSKIKKTEVVKLSFIYLLLLFFFILSFFVTFALILLFHFLTYFASYWNTKTLLWRCTNTFRSFKNSRIWRKLSDSWTQPNWNQTKRKKKIFFSLRTYF